MAGLSTMMVLLKDTIHDVVFTKDKIMPLTYKEYNLRTSNVHFLTFYKVDAS